MDDTKGDFSYEILHSTPPVTFVEVFSFTCLVWLGTVNLGKPLTFFLDHWGLRWVG